MLCRARRFVGHGLLPLLLLFFSFSSAFGQAVRVSKPGVDPDQPQGDKDNPAARAAWFMQGRRTFDGSSPAAALHRAHQQKMAIRRAQQQAAQPGSTTLTPGATTGGGTPSTIVGGPWTSIGPAPITGNPTGTDNFGFSNNPDGNFNGRVQSIVVDTSDGTGNTVLVGSAYGGVWRSTNAAGTPSSVTWTPLFDTNAAASTLSMGAIAIKPGTSGNTQVILAGTGEPDNAIDSYYGQGILRSTDGGSTWSMISSANSGANSFRGIGFSKIAFSTASTSLVVAAGAQTPIGATNGLSGSTGAHSAIYTSTDSGATWSQATANDPGPTAITFARVTDVVFDAGGTSTGGTVNQFFAAVAFHGFYSSSDGLTWTRMPDPPSSNISTTNCPAATVTSCQLYRASLAVQPTTGDLFMVLVPSAGSTTELIYKANFSGGSVTSWTKFTTTLIDSCGDNNGGCGTGGQGFYDLYIAAVPNGSNTDIYYGAVNLFKCTWTGGTSTCSATSGNNTWLDVTHVYSTACGTSFRTMHPDNHALAAVPGSTIVYFGNDGGVYRTLNGTILNGTCGGSGNLIFDLNTSSLGSFSQFVSITTHPTDLSVTFGGTQDNGSPATAGGQSSPALTPPLWFEAWGGDGGYTAIDASGTNWYTANTGVSVQQCTAGTNCIEVAGFTQIVGSGQVGGDSGAFYTPFILDPANTADIIVGTCCHVFRGLTNGLSLTALTPLLNTTGDFRSLAAGGPTSGGLSQVIYAGTDGGHVFVTTNAAGGSGTWVDRTGSINPNSFSIHSIAIDTSVATGQTAYLTIQGFTGGTGHVWKTTSAGGSWTDITGNLPDAPVNSVLVDPGNHNIVYVGTDVGVFMTTNPISGATWNEYGNNMPNVAVLTLKAAPYITPTRLRAGTYGRGVFEIALASAADYSLNISDTPQTVLVGSLPAVFHGTATAIGSFSSTVNLTCTAGGTPAPTTCTPAPTPITPTGGGAGLTVTTSDVAADYSFNLHGVGTDVNTTTHDAAIALHIVDFALSAPAPNPVTIPRGTSNTVTFSVSASGSFSGSVALSCTGLPAGMTCSNFSPSATVSPTSGVPVSVTLTISTISSLAVASYPINVVGTPSSPSGPAKQQGLSVSVTTNPDFSLSSAASLVSRIGQTGVSGTAAITYLDGFASTVNLSCSVNATGIGACGVTPNSVTGSNAGLSVSVDAGTAVAGNYTATLSGTGGAKTHSMGIPYAIWDYSVVAPGGSPASPVFVTSGATTNIGFTLHPLNGQQNVNATCTAITNIPGASCSIVGGTNPISLAGGDVALSAALTVPGSTTICSGSPCSITIHTTDNDVPSTAAHDQVVNITVQNFTLTTGANTTRALAPGQTSQTFDLTVTAGSGFSSAVALSCPSGLPTGGACIFSQNNFVPSGAGTPLTVTVSTTGATPTGNFPFTVAGSANGATKSADNPFTLQVQDYAIAPTPSTRILTPGNSVTFTINDTATNGFAPSATLSCPVSLPTGMTCVFTPSATVAPGSSVTLTVNTTSSTPVQNNAFTITGAATNGPGTVTRTTTVNVNVESFTQQVNPTTQTVLTGASANYTASYTAQNGFSSNITVACTGLAAGMGCTPAPNPVTPGTPSTVNVTTTAGVTPSTVNFAITGTGLGLTQSTPVTLNLSDFSLSPSATSATINSTASTSFTLTVTGLNGFAGTVALACPTPPTGVTCGFGQNNFTPSSSGTGVGVTLQTSNSTLGGVYPFAITATSGAITHSFNFTLTVKDYTLVVTPASQTISNLGGGTVGFTVTLTANNGFFGNAQLSCPAPPAGLSCSFNPGLVSPTAGGATSALTVTVSPSAATGPLNFTVQGSVSFGAGGGGGPVVRTQGVTVINGVDFSLTASPNPIVVQEGGTNTDTIGATTTGGFSSQITLSCTNVSPAPAAGTLSCTSFTPNPFTPVSQTSALLLTASANLTPGVYTVTVSGTGGSITHTKALTVNVPDYTLGLSPGSQAVVAGNPTSFSGTATAIAGFAATVNLSCGVTPSASGVSCSTTGSSVVPTGGFTANVLTTAGAANGPYTITVTGDDGAGHVHQATATVNVQNFAVAATDSSPSIQAGQTTPAFNGTVTGSGGFTGNVAMSCTSGSVSLVITTCAFTPNPVAASNGGAPYTVTIATSNTSVAGGPYAVTLTGTVGSATQTATVHVTITPPPPDFNLNVTPSSQTIQAGGSTSFTGNTTAINGFSNALTFTCTGAPAGVACTPPGSPVAVGSPATINITSTLGTVAPGSYPLTIQATDGTKTHSQQVTLVVQDFTLGISPGSQSVNVGGSANYTVSMTAGGTGFPATANLACLVVGSPTGVSCSLLSSTLTAGNSTTLTVSSTGAAAVNTYTVQVTATAGVTAHSASTSFVVTSSDFSLAITGATSATVAAGSSTSTTILVTAINGFSGTVALSCPVFNNVSCGFSLNNFVPSASGTSVTVTISTTTASLGGPPQTVTITGTGSSLTHTATFSLSIKDFTITVAPPSQTISTPGGGSTTYTVTVTANNGFTGNVSLSCPTPPTGLSCTFSPNFVSASPTGANSTLTLTVSGTAAAGSILFTVQGATGGGAAGGGASLTRTQTATVINGQDFTLTASPNPIVVQEGGTNTDTIGATVTGGFSSQITLSCTNVSPAPAAGTLGCTSFTPNPFTPVSQTSALLLTASANLTPGVYTVTVSGTGGSITHTKALTVNVPDYTLGLSPGSQAVVASNPTSFSGTATAVAGFASTVNLSCGVTPSASGVSCSTTGSSVVPTGGFTANVLTTAGAANGPYTITVTGDDGAGHVHQATATVNVQNFSVAATDSSPSIQAGQTTPAFNGTVTGTGGFTGNVAMSCTSGSVNLVITTCAFTPNPVAATSGGAPYTVTIATSNTSVAGGPYAVTLTGTVGSATQTATVHVTITPPPPDFNLNVTPPSQTIQAGGSTSFTGNTTAINGFSNSLTFTCTGAPAGVACTPPGSPVAVGSPATINITSTLGTVAAGSYPLTIQATDGSKTHSQQVTLVVQDFSIGISPGSQSVNVGGSANYTVSMTAGGTGFPATANLACLVVGSPTGVSCSLLSSTLTAGNSTTLTVSSTGAAAPSTYTVQVTATAGVTAHSASTSFTISNGPDFSLSTSTPSIAISRGSFGKYVLTVTALNGFADSVKITCSGAPAGVFCGGAAGSVTVTPSASGTTVNFSVSVSSSAVPGTYNFQLLGTDTTTPSINHSIPVSLTIN